MCMCVGSGRQTKGVIVAWCCFPGRRKSQPEGLLKGIKFTCLGLGDSNYTRFCAVPKAFAKRFKDLGAENFHPNLDVDEVDGIEEPVEAWCEKLRPALAAVCKPENSGAEAEAPAAGTGASKAPAAPVAAAAAPVPAAPAAKAAAPVPAPGTPLTGSAALLARMRADRSKPAPKTKNVVVLYASQTGTAEEIAKGIAAEASAAGHKTKVRRSTEQRCLKRSRLHHHPHCITDFELCHMTVLRLQRVWL